MPYNTYTNDSDTQFAAQIDRYKLGPGVSPGGSEFWAAEAAMNALGNDQMNVARLMQARASLHGASMETRQNIQSERMIKEDMDEYDDFLPELRDSTVEGDFEGNAKRRMDLLMKHPDNLMVKQTLSDMDQASTWGLKGKKAASENADVDFMDSVRKEKEALQLGEVRRATKASRLLDDQAEEAINANTDRKYEIIGNMTASIFRLDPVMAENLTRARSRMMRSNDEKGIANLTRIASIYNKSLLLEGAFAPEMAKAEELHGKLKSRGVDISKIDSPEAEAKALTEMLAVLEKEYSTNTGDKAKDAKNKRTQQNYVDSFEKTTGLRKLLNERKGIADSVSALFAKNPEKGSPEETMAMEDLEVLLGRAADHAGFVNNHIAQKAKAMDDADQMLDLQTKSIKLINEEQKGKIALDKLALARRVVDLRERGMKDDVISDTLRLALMTDDNQRRTPEKLNEVLAEVYQIALDLREKAGSGADPIDF